MDARGRVVRLMGINVPGMERGSGRPDTTEGPDPCPSGWRTPPPGAAPAVRRWGFNVVRLPFSWADLEPSPPVRAPDGLLVHHYDAAYVDALRAVVDQFTSRGVGVILDQHQYGWTPAFVLGRAVAGCPGEGLPVWLYRGTAIHDVAAAKRAFFLDKGGVQEQMAEAWRYLASQFRSNPMVVGADLLNEPYVVSPMPPAAAGLDRLYDTLGVAVRAGDPRLLLFVEDTQDLGTGQFGMRAPPALPGIVYSFHLYRPAWDPWGRAEAADYLARARAWGIPAWIGEFNAFGSGLPGSPDRNWVADTESLLRFCAANGLGWAYWAMSGPGALVPRGARTAREPLLGLLRWGFDPGRSS